MDNYLFLSQHHAFPHRYKWMNETGIKMTYMDTANVMIFNYIFWN